MKRSSTDAVFFLLLREKNLALVAFYGTGYLVMIKSAFAPPPRPLCLSFSFSVRKRFIRFLLPPREEEGQSCPNHPIMAASRPVRTLEPTVAKSRLDVTESSSSHVPLVVSSFPLLGPPACLLSEFLLPGSASVGPLFVLCSLLLVFTHYLCVFLFHFFHFFLLHYFLIPFLRFLLLLFSVQSCIFSFFFFLFLYTDIHKSDRIVHDTSMSQAYAMLYASSFFFPLLLLRFCFLVLILFLSFCLSFFKQGQY